MDCDDCRYHEKDEKIDYCNAHLFATNDMDRFFFLYDGDCIHWEKI